ncbi:hypothetical protein C2G38_2255995 [Gigaspora rosea]|uniref:Uncharacterized protein n=1 Tax=Gigaspora rosea TaxID=44941 RepID=A0A397TZ69_9GLOM|nr:hypothetical protein C2G38_2255995 [Gigaspora rosea]
MSAAQENMEPDHIEGTSVSAQINEQMEIDNQQEVPQKKVKMDLDMIIETSQEYESQNFETKNNEEFEESAEILTKHNMTRDSHDMRDQIKERQKEFLQDERIFLEDSEEVYSIREQPTQLNEDKMETKSNATIEEKGELTRDKLTMVGNSNWFEWQWPINGDLEGCILARSIPNIGDWTIFTQTQLEKLQKYEIKKPTPHTSTPTTPISDWYIPPPNPAHIRPDRLSKESLIKQLHLRCFEIDEKENKHELVKKIRIKTNDRYACNEVLVKVLMNKVDNKTQQQDIDNIFSLHSGWALKENQKFAGNANKSDRYNAQDMHKELLKCAEEGEISNKEVPKPTTIQNWITKTTAEHRERAALKVLNENTS